MKSHRILPRVADYHSGPYRLGAILQDPGTVHVSGCNAQKTGEIGVLNGDPTADLCKKALDINGIALSEYLPMNAIPWYDAPSSRTNAMLKEGAEYNRKFILETEIKLVLLLGKDAWRSETFLKLPTYIETRRLPHPGRLGLIHYHENGIRIGTTESRQKLIKGFSLANLSTKKPPLKLRSGSHSFERKY